MLRVVKVGFGEVASYGAETHGFFGRTAEDQRVVAFGRLFLTLLWMNQIRSRQLENMGHQCWLVFSRGIIIPGFLRRAGFRASTASWLSSTFVSSAEVLSLPAAGSAFSFAIALRTESVQRPLIFHRPRVFGGVSLRVPLILDGQHNLITPIVLIANALEQIHVLKRLDLPPFCLLVASLPSST